MAYFGGSFDASQVEPKGDYRPVPPGEYKVQITSSEFCQTSTGNGHQLKLEMEILEGDQAGRRLYDRLNLDNPNAQAVEIAQRTLSAICHATGKLQVNDSVDLHLVPMSIQVGVKPPKDGYSEKNTIRYLVPDKTAPAAHQPAPAPSQSAAPAAAPWNRNT